MVLPDWFWITYVFMVGCCVGSFLNVIIYRLPRDKSLVMPPSACPNCGKRIRFYDNIPLISWLVLRAKCRNCKAKISARYFIIELLTGIIFAGLFVLYFHVGIRDGIGSFLGGGWFVYTIHIILIAALIAASAIDLELWVIPVFLCWFVTAVGLLGSGLAPFAIKAEIISKYLLLPSASADTASLAAGAAIGLILSMLLLATGIIKGSYLTENEDEESEFNHRLEVCKEIVFLLPLIICSIAAYWIVKNNPEIHNWWQNFSQVPFVAGFAGSLWGYFIGCGVVWAARIFGTLGFGKEAMGLGDVHLMGAAGAVIGAEMAFIAFFIAPFFGLAWALWLMFFKKTRQIPYGPFLSLAVFTVMIFHDKIYSLIVENLQFSIYH
ncbi:MAG: prepilin peptidase [Planctomycetes bacterium]|nr:prepilin peptidase [Planctomycetota bacterium]